MNTEQETNIRMEENELNLGDILQTVLANWYWFVLSVVVCAGTAFLYLKWAPKVYTRTASVLIKDDAKGGAMSESAAFEDLGLFGSKRNVDNEVLVFKSRRLMTEVARNLHLDVSYTVKDGLRTVELYTQSPVQLSFKFQLNLFSLAGVYGARPAKYAAYLMKEGFYDYAGSDLHHPDDYKRNLARLKLSGKMLDGLREVLENNKGL